MRGPVLAVSLALGSAAAVAEVRDQDFTVGNQVVQIEVVAQGEILWAGPNPSARTQVLSGPDIEIVGFITDDAAMQMLGTQVLVAVVPGTHSCENLDDPLAYHVVTLREELVTDGPLTTCVELAVSATSGAVVLEENPMGDGEFHVWIPGQGFGGAAN